MRGALLLCVLPAALAFSCSSNLDCMLNGVCSSSGTCICDPVWKGDDCSLLAFKPNAIEYMQQGYGQSTSVNISSWGGNSVLGDDGLYHLFVAEMVEGCPLSFWHKNSRISHATSKTQEGPYAYQDSPVGVWAHNPQVVQWKEDGKAQYALFHIGTGVHGHPSHCAASGNALKDVNTLGVSETGGSVLHTSTSPNGPWTAATNAIGECNNPSPLRMTNGTWFLVCDSTTVKRAESLADKWTTISSTSRAGESSSIRFEDAFLFQDPRGGFHVLYHKFNKTQPCGECLGHMVTGHDFSEDLYTWHSSPVEPFDNTYTTTDGQTITVSTRERPKLLFNADGVPTHLVSGVSNAASCPPFDASHCKQTSPGWWTYTLVAPLVTAA